MELQNGNENINSFPQKKNNLNMSRIEYETKEIHFYYLFIYWCYIMYLS